MNVMSRLPSILGMFAVILSSGVGAGCQSKGTQLEVTAFRSSSSPEIYREQFDAGYYCINADQSWTFIFEIKPVQVSTSQPGDDAASEPTAEAVSAGDVLWMSQIVEVEVFWRPQPGRSYAESSQTNANIVYGLTTGAGSITYEGAGFVSFSLSADKKRMQGRIESSTLYPARTVNAPPDLFGPCRMTGSFTAVEDRKHVVEKLREIRRRVGPPVSGTSTGEY